MVWYGNKDANVPGAGFGGEIPARIWKSFMDVQLAGQPVAAFPAPGPVCTRRGVFVDEFGRHTERSAGSVDANGQPITTTAPTVVVNPPTTPTTAAAPATAPHP